MGFVHCYALDFKAVLCHGDILNRNQATGKPCHRCRITIFGLLIAYIIPGFGTLVGLGPFSETIQLWLSFAAADNAPTVAGFLYGTVASVGIGMLLSAIRYATIDQINERTGLPRPRWDDRNLQANFDAFQNVVDQHFRYYQFHANTIIAALVVIGAHLWHGEIDPSWFVLLIPLFLIFWITARSNLHRYYDRTTTLLDTKGHQP